MGRHQHNSLSIVRIEIVPNTNHVRTEVSQTLKCRMLHGVVRYVELKLDEREGREGSDSLAAKGEITLDVSDVTVIAVERLLDNGICVSLEVSDEPPLASLRCCLYSVLPEPNERSIRSDTMDSGSSEVCLTVE